MGTLICSYLCIYQSIYLAVYLKISDLIFCIIIHAAWCKTFHELVFIVDVDNGKLLIDFERDLKTTFLFFIFTDYVKWSWTVRFNYITLLIKCKALHFAYNWHLATSDSHRRLHHLSASIACFIFIVWLVSQKILQISAHRGERHAFSLGFLAVLPHQVSAKSSHLNVKLILLLPRPAG